MPAFAEGTRRKDKCRDRPAFTVETFDGPIEIMRNQDKERRLIQLNAMTSRRMPPVCIQPHANRALA